MKRVKSDTVRKRNRIFYRYRSEIFARPGELYNRVNGVWLTASLEPNGEREFRVVDSDESRRFRTNRLHSSRTNSVEINTLYTSFFNDEIFHPKSKTNFERCDLRRNNTRVKIQVDSEPVAVRREPKNMFEPTRLVRYNF